MENQEKVRCMHGCPYHPATGHILEKTGKAVLCGRHTREFFTWVKEHTNGWARRKKNHKVVPSFYDHAATSIRAK